MSIEKLNIVLASHNKNKLQEIKDTCKSAYVNFSLATDFNLSDPIEDGLTFADNALIKAKFVSEATGLIALSDDSGLEIEALGNIPGVFSARYAEGDATYQVAFDKIANLLKQHENKTARFVSCMCLYVPTSLIQSMNLEHLFSGKNYIFFEGIIKGAIEFPPRGEYGFAYDKIFTPNGYKHTFAELQAGEKNAISHRSIAINKFVNFITSIHE